MLSKRQVPVHAGDSNSPPPISELEALTKWLDCRMLVGVSAGFPTHAVFILFPFQQIQLTQINECNVGLVKSQKIIVRISVQYRN